MIPKFQISNFVPPAKPSRRREASLWRSTVATHGKFQIKNGFTLVELLVVISILGVLAALVLSNLSSIRERARDVQRKNDLNQIKNSLKMYKNDFGTYPATGTGGTIKGCGTAGAEDCSWGSAFFVTSGNTYMNTLPDDPGSTSYVYTFIDKDSFTLYAILENVSDQDIAKSQTRCGGSVENAYYVCSD